MAGFRESWISKLWSYSLIRHIYLLGMQHDVLYRGLSISYRKALLSPPLIGLNIVVRLECLGSLLLRCWCWTSLYCAPSLVEFIRNWFMTNVAYLVSCLNILIWLIITRVYRTRRRKETFEFSCSTRLI